MVERGGNWIKRHVRCRELSGSALWSFIENTNGMEGRRSVRLSRNVFIVSSSRL
jgi:hypothetical protein